MEDIKNNNCSITSNTNKLPTIYSNKTFPFFSLPLLEASFWFKDKVEVVLSYFYTPDTSFEGTVDFINKVNRDRELLTAVKVQRYILKFQRRLKNAIRNNKYGFTFKVKGNSNESLLIAHAVKNHFLATGKVKIAISNLYCFSSVHLDTEIVYE